MSPEISARRSLFGRAEFLIPVVTGQLGREGEKCRPLDHVWQTPFIHSTLFVITIIFCIYRKAFQLFHSYGTYKCVPVRCVFQNCACALVENSALGSEPSLKSLCFPCVTRYAYWHKRRDVYICAFDEGRNRQASHALLVFLFSFVFRTGIPPREEYYHCVPGKSL